MCTASSAGGTGGEVLPVLHAVHVRCVLPVTTGGSGEGGVYFLHRQVRRGDA